MNKDSSNMKAGYITVRNDPRVTFLGHYLRLYKLNELPQIFNILLGHMSFVGPRPLMKVSFDSYSSNVQDFLYKSKPGLTGIGSIIFRDEEDLISNAVKSGVDPEKFYRDVIYSYKGKIEKWYFENKSFVLDFKILLFTAYIIFFPKTELVNKFFNNLPSK